MTRFPVMKLGVCSTLAISALSAVACSNPPPQVAPFVFNRPEHLEFVCFDPEGSGAVDAPVPLVLPLECCAGPTPFNPALHFADRGEKAKVCGIGSPALHALVTQSTRGEVAAVDVIAHKVLDSDQRVPGNTFVDVGGLPRAIVTPSHRPGKGNEKLGPLWTYVASGEQRALRAVATCHFREGAKCGPEEALSQSENVLSYEDATRLALAGTPRDMVFADDALWVTLPDISAIARVALPTDKAQANPFPERGAIDYFSLPVVAATEPVVPVRDESEYVTACGLGYPVLGSVDAPLEILRANEVEGPTSTVAVGAGVSTPTRIRFYKDENNPEDNGLLLVADATQPVVHALSIEAGKPRLRGTIATGAPIRDFALTPRAVPKLAPALKFADPENTDKGKVAFDADEARYFYAIDDRDGSVMVHSFDYAGEAVSTVPLRLPSTRDRVDRLPLDAAATAIDIADNRALYRDKAERDFVCDADLNYEDALGISVSRQKTKVADAKSALDAARENDSEGTSAAFKAAQETYDQALAKLQLLDAKKKVLDKAASTQLRGVFAMITTLDGAIRVVDLHDLDMLCRSEAACADDGEKPAKDDVLGFALRRHTLRISSAAKYEDLDVSDTPSLQKVSCEPGRYVAAKRGKEATNGREPDAGGGGAVSDAGQDPGTPDGGMDDAGAMDAGGAAAGGADAGGGKEPPKPEEDDVLVCTASDPWLVGNAGWSAQWAGAYFGGAQGRLSPCGAGDGCAKNAKYVLYAPSGVDLCARGVVDSEQGSEAGGGAYDGDRVYFYGAPPDSAANGCAAPESADEPHLTIVRAFKDRLELRRAPRTGDEGSSLSNFDADDARIRKLLDCSPTFVTFATRVGDRFLVKNTSAGVVLHRMMANEEGRCVADPERDPLLVSRAKTGMEFRNIYSTFMLSEQAEKDSEIVIGATASSTNSPFSARIGQSGTESLPVSVRYFDLTGELYVVDVAQGLRRFFLAPEFKLDPESNR